MINYLTPEKFLRFDPLKPPAAQGGGGGMSSKVSRVLKALREVYPKTRGISEVSAIDADTVLIEPLRFVMVQNDPTQPDYEDVDLLLSQLADSPVKKIIYCSEFAMLRLTPAYRRQLLKQADAITANCEFHK